MNLMQLNHSGCAGKSPLFWTLPRTGLDGNLKARGCAADLDSPPAHRNLAHLGRRRQAQGRVDGLGARARIGGDVLNPASQPAAQQRRRQRGRHRHRIGHETLKEIIILAQQPGMTGQRRLDGGPRRRQWPKDRQPQTAPGVVAGSVVLVDDHVVDPDAVEAGLQRRFREAQKGPDPRDARIMVLDESRRSSAPAAPLANQVQQQTLGDVATVVPQQKAAKTVAAGHVLQCVIPGRPHGGFVTVLEGQGGHLARKTKVARPGAHARRLG